MRAAVHIGRTASSKPGVKVSWQVGGVREDAYANRHRNQVQVPKSGPTERLGDAIERQVAAATRPGAN